MNRPHRTALAVSVFFASSLLSAQAEVKLPAILSDNAVLQQGAEAPIWGTAAPGEKVTVEFAGQKLSATASQNGHWLVKLAPLTVSAENREIKVTGDRSAAPLVVKNVLVGEVWLCSGQSNMEWALGKTIGGPEAIAAAANPLLRLCTVPHNSQMAPQEDAPAKWAVAGPDTTKFFSSVGYYMGAKLQKELNEPVAIINDSYGGTKAESWMPVETLRKGPWPQDKNTDITISKADYDKRKSDLQPAMDKYLADKAEAIKNKTAQPTFPAGWPGDFRGPSVLWNGMVRRY